MGPVNTYSHAALPGGPQQVHSCKSCVFMVGRLVITECCLPTGPCREPRTAVVSHSAGVNSTELHLRGMVNS